ncbi:hypothetical protein MCETHM1_03139 [Flavobacteriaceae bacterium]|jgi:hypothetical protein
MKNKNNKASYNHKNLNTTNLVATFIDIFIIIEKHSKGMLKIINYNI